MISDARIKAIVGYVPYFGQPVLPAFGRDQSGLDGITVPFLGIAGFDDTTAPLPTTAQGVLRLTQSRELVALEGVGHYFDFPSAPDIFTWTLTFLSAHVNDDRNARASVARMISVRGGGDDRLLIDYTAPATDTATERDVIEFYNASLNHYFLTADTAEAAMLDAGVVVPGWTRTGYNFKSWLLDAQIGAPWHADFSVSPASDPTRISTPSTPTSARLSRPVPIGNSKATRLRSNRRSWVIARPD